MTIAFTLQTADNHTEKNLKSIFVSEKAGYDKDVGFTYIIKESVTKKCDNVI